MKSIEAIKTFFERKDKIAPNGGRPMPNSEILAFGKQNPPGSLRDLAVLCAAELNVEITEP